MLTLGTIRVVSRAVSAGLGGSQNTPSAPPGPLAPAGARALLLAVPLVVLAGWDTWRALAALDVETAVSCCAAVYEVAGGRGAAGSAPGGTWVGLFVAGAALLVALGVAQAASRRLARGRALPWALAGVAIAWTLVAGSTLVHELTAYHYEVLAHDCAWCLFLGEHGGVGYALFAALAVVALEGPAGALASAFGRRHGALSDAATARTRRAGLTAALAVVVFVAVASWPAVAWYVTHGMWIR